MTKGIIYKITSPSGNTYIGQTVNLKRRLRRYAILDCKKQQKIYRSILKYGWDNHIIDIIETVEKNILDEREMYWIKFYHSFSNGLNGSAGGESISYWTGKNRSQETNDKISKKLMGNVPWNKGGKMNYSEAGLISYKKTRELMCRPVFCITNGVTYKSLTDAGKALGVSRGEIWRVLSGTRKTVRKHKFKYAA